MNRALSAVVAALSLSVLAACSTPGSATQPTAGAGSSPAGDKVIRVAGTGTSYPHSYADGGQQVGFDADVIREAAKRAGYTVQYSTMDFPGLMPAVTAGRIDTTATNITWTEERGKNYYFTTAYAFDGVGFAAKADNAKITSYADLEGGSIATGAGSTNEAVSKKWIAESGHKVDLRSFDTAASALQEVQTGRADVLAGPRGSTIAQIKNKGLGLKWIGEILSFEQTRFPFANTERGRKLAEEISTQLEAMQADGTLSKLSEKYFTYDRTKPEGGDFTTPNPDEITSPAKA